MNILNLKIILLPANLFPGIITCSTLMSINEADRKNLIYFSCRISRPYCKVYKAHILHLFLKIWEKSIFISPPSPFRFQQGMISMMGYFLPLCWRLQPVLANLGPNSLELCKCNSFYPSRLMCCQSLITNNSILAHNPQDTHMWSYRIPKLVCLGCS